MPRSPRPLLSVFRMLRKRSRFSNHPLIDTQWEPDRQLHWWEKGWQVTIFEVWDSPCDLCRPARRRPCGGADPPGHAPAARPYPMPHAGPTRVGSRGANAQIAVFRGGYFRCVLPCCVHTTPARGGGGGLYAVWAPHAKGVFITASVGLQLKNRKRVQRHERFSVEQRAFLYEQRLSVGKWRTGCSAACSAAAPAASSSASQTCAPPQSR